MSGTILSMDDDPTSSLLIQNILENEGYHVYSARSGMQGLSMLSQEGIRPDLILLDQDMPQMDGLQVCKHLQNNPQFSLIPVIFLTGKDATSDRVKALNAGAVDFILKPVSKVNLLKTITKHLQTHDTWSSAFITSPQKYQRVPIRTLNVGAQDIPKSNTLQQVLPDFKHFIPYLLSKANLPLEGEELKLEPQNLYAQAETLGFTGETLAQLISRFSKIQYTEEIRNAAIELGILPALFCQQYRVIPLQSLSGQLAFVLEQPFDLELQQALSLYQDAPLFIAKPTLIDSVLGPLKIPHDKDLHHKDAPDSKGGDLEEENTTLSTASSGEALVVDALDMAFERGVQALHFEHQPGAAAIRYRQDLQLQTYRASLAPEVMVQALRYVKNRMGLNPQSLEAQTQQLQHIHHNRPYELKLQSVPLSQGEKLVIQIQNPAHRITKLEKLGFTPEQEQLYRNALAARNGVILHIGYPGSGRQTAMYTALHYLNQPNVNIHTFEYAPRSSIAGIQAMRYDPDLTVSSLIKQLRGLDTDILAMDPLRPEIFKSLYPAKILAKMEAANPIDAIMRLINQGVSPYLLYTRLSLICGHVLLPKLCIKCRHEKEIPPEVAEQIGLESSFHAAGCKACQDTGFQGVLPLFELRVPNAELYRILIKPSLSESDLAAWSQAQGDSLYKSGLDAVKAGQISLAELGNIRAI